MGACMMSCCGWTGERLCWWWEGNVWCRFWEGANHCYYIHPLHVSLWLHSMLHDSFPHEHWSCPAHVACPGLAQLWSGKQALHRACPWLHLNWSIGAISTDDGDAALVSQKDLKGYQLVFNTFWETGQFVDKIVVDGKANSCLKAFFSAAAAPEECVSTTASVSWPSLGRWVLERAAMLILYLSNFLATRSSCLEACQPWCYPLRFVYSMS